MFKLHRAVLVTATVTAALATTASSASAANIGDLCKVVYGSGGVAGNTWVRITGYPTPTSYEVRQSGNIYNINRSSVDQNSCTS